MRRYAARSWRNVDAEKCVCSDDLSCRFMRMSIYTQI